jgi:hypothetical protein
VVFDAFTQDVLERQLGVHSRYEALAIAEERGLL